ncbi:MAG: XRE family transcriptional regulator [Proteobacteria bacterium]|nr:MAG: XRE family transcriptional regulator [Pseudomonadota bacterium]
MAARKCLGEKLAMLVKSSGKSQTAIADRLEMPVSQLNRFLRGHSALTSTNLAAVMAELGIDLDEIISARIRQQAQVETHKIETPDDCVRFLFGNLDELGRQTYLKNLAWAVKISSNGSLPTRVEEILKSEMTLI